MAKKKVKSKAKQPPKPTPSIAETINPAEIAAAYSSVPQPIFMKVCRLCESKDGPFLNIFDADKVTAKKIDELMPFGIAENDDLPHKICFRCSAKLEELYEFIQKCIKTQENLRTAVGKTGPFIVKNKTRTVWEEKLNKTNMSNDDICDALIKKAMEGIKDIPLKPLPVEDKPPPQPTKRVTRRTEQSAPKKELAPDESKDECKINLKPVKLALEKYDVKEPPTKLTKSINVEETPSRSNKTSKKEKKTGESTVKNNSLINSLSFDYVEEKKSSDSDSDEEKKSSENDEEKKKEPEKPFNIMDYISMIKVNGVGVLFQCKLCNRNFLKKEVVESHNCAKNGVPKVEIPKTVPVPEPPKVSTVKYIKIDSDMKTSLSWKPFKSENDKIPSNNHKIKNEIPSTDYDKNKYDSQCTDKNKKQEDNIKCAPKAKSRPKVGPASKTRRVESITEPGPSQKNSNSQDIQSSNSESPSVHIPSVPNLNGRYKLVPGPNNIFTLVEESASVTNHSAPVTNHTAPVSNYSTLITNQVPNSENQKTGRKRKSETEILSTIETKSKERKKDSCEKSRSPEVINPQNQSKPYPVGLFQTVAHSARLYEPPIATPPAPFTTPAMKKQSYTIVQTGNPSKLLISTKAQAPPAEVPKKRQRKSKIEVSNEPNPGEPFKVTLEDVAHPKDTGFFTFINVDPLLQPSYVLPTDNIIQESQISTSSAIIRTATENSKENSKDKDKYTCNMCGETFSREKKLLAHIQSHYTKMDEEDQMRAEKGSKKKGKK